MISVNLIDVETYQVHVESAPTREFQVTLRAEDHKRLSGGGCTQEWTIVQAFHFLLEREPAEAILTRFDLMEVERYFPGFVEDMQERLRDR